jgi:molybdate transport system ATP-binding protein
MPYGKVRAMKSPSQLQLQLTDVSFSYRALPVLQSINWQWQRGEQWACLGPNGAGKTTLAKILSAQLRCVSGEIEYGQNLQRQDIAYVCFEQQQALCNRDRQLDDSEFRSDASDPGTTVGRVIRATATDESELNHWLQRLGLAHILDRGIRFISTGEMRKTLLLRAILARPALLILDSPLDGLDRASQREMSDILEQLLDSGLNLLLLCRQAQDIPTGVSHLLMLDQGQLIACGRRDQVLANATVQYILNPPVTALGPLPPAANRPYQIPPGQPLLKLVDVAVSYGDVAVLKNLNWVFESGQHCSISGPNGCGKTTLLSLINGDNHKAYGQDITLFGVKRGSGESVWDIKQKFGLLNTQLHLNHIRGMRVLEVVVSGFFDTVGLYDDWGDQQRQIAGEWLLALGLDELGRAHFDTLSFGMQRMVLLARAMVKSPVILILDEPCLGLDGHHTRIILRAIDHIAEHTDTQVLFVSHCASETPTCINQWLEFVAGKDSYALACRQA